MTRRQAFRIPAAAGLPAAALLAAVVFSAVLFATGCATVDPGIRVEPADASLARSVQKIARGAGGRFGIAVRHLESGRTFEWNAGETFEGASVVKITLLAEALAESREGRLDLGERWRLTRRGMAAGSGVLGEFEPGLEPTVRDLLRLMDVVSDNTAANALIDRFGAGDVNRRMAALGMPGIRIVGRIPDRYPEESESSRWKGLALGEMTPRDTALFWQKAATGTLVDAEASRLALELTKDPRTSDRLPRHLRKTETTTWSGKTGTMNGVRGDSGVLGTRKGRFVFAAFVDRIPESEAWRAGPAMGEIAKAIVDAWSKELPDLPLAVEPVPPPALAPAVARLELTPAEAARTDLPLAARVFGAADLRFWELWKAAGGGDGGEDACLVPSPNSWWAGMDPAKIEPLSAVVVHHTAMETDAECVEMFLDPRSRVSSHFLVGTDGRLWQFVSLDDRAWHAGASRLHGRWALNRTSVGIEITGNGNAHPFTPAQLRTAARLVGVLVAMYDVPAPWIAGHEHVAPDRKNDPGRLFPWNDVLREALETARRLSPGEDRRVAR